MLAGCASSRGGVATIALLAGTLLALAGLLLALSPVRAQEVSECESKDKPQVPGAVDQSADCLPDLTTRILEADTDHTNPTDWEGLHAPETINPAGPPDRAIPGLQIDGYFPDGSDSTNCNNTPVFLDTDFTECHDSQFVIRLPDEWNGKLVITGAPGVRRQFANDFIISDFVLSKDYDAEGGYAFASTDKGNTGTSFYQDGERPGAAVAEWHRRVEELTKAAKSTVEQWYGEKPDYTYMTGISNGGYLTRHAVENNPELYDGAVDWEGTLFRRNGPNLFTHLPQALRHYHECQDSAPLYNDRACELMYRAGYKKGSEFLWPEHEVEYWDLTQRIYREEFDPGYDGEQEAGYPLCQEEVTPPPKCDANYKYKKRPERVKDRVQRVSLDGDIGVPMLTLHGTLDSLLPIRRHSGPYRKLIESQGKGKMHRYYVIEDGSHVDSWYERYRTELRPILPCYWAAFEEIEEWVEQPASPNGSPPKSKFVPKPEDLQADLANSCSINQEATYSPPVQTP